VVEENDQLKDELKNAFKEVNKAEMSNVKKKQMIFELREKISDLQRQLKS
jgi:hypothetical protein